MLRCYDSVFLMGFCLVHYRILHYAIYTDDQKLFNSIITRVTHCKWLNIQNNQLQSPLHLAVIQNQPHNVRRLVSWGASIDLRDKHGNTPLHLACDRLRVECVIALTTHLGRSDVKEVPYKVPFQRMPQNMDLLNYSGSYFVEFSYILFIMFFPCQTG